MNKVEIIETKTKNETYTFEQLLNEEFCSPMLAAQGEGEDVFLILPAENSDYENTLIYVGDGVFRSVDNDSWDRESFTLRKTKDIDLRITV